VISSPSAVARLDAFTVGAAVAQPGPAPYNPPPFEAGQRGPKPLILELSWNKMRGTTQMI